LQTYSLDQLTLIGVIKRAKDEWAVFTTPDKKVYRAKKESLIGQNQGRIVTIADGYIEVEEKIPGAVSDAATRMVTLSVKRPTKH